MRTNAAAILVAAVVATATLAATLSAQSWQPAAVAGPALSLVHGAAYDEDRGVVVVVGRGGMPPHADTWEWDGRAWRRIATPNPPLLEYDNPDYLDLTWDTAGRRIVMAVGPRTGASGMSLFAFDGRDWSVVRAANAPPGVGLGVQIACDRTRGALVTWSGNSVSELRGGTWRQVLQSPAPGRETTQLVHDEARGVTLLYGGRTGRNPNTYDGRVYEWDGQQWSTTTAPLAARSDAAAAFDATRGRVLSFGGQSYAGDGNLWLQFSDTHEWDGSTWSMALSPFGPPQAAYAEMVHDLRRGRTMLFVPGAVARVFELVRPAPATYERYGAGCAGTVGTPQLDWAQGALARLGAPLALRTTALPAAGTAALALGLSNASWLGRPLPLDLTPHGMPGCVARASADLLLLAPIQQGTVMWSALLPTVPALVGQRLYVQAWVTDPGANTLGATISNAAALGLGQR